MIFMPSADEAKIVRGKDGKMRLENFYTPLAEAKKEIQRRQRDKKLKKKIEDFLEGDIPDIFKKKPKAVFARHIATPNLEHLYFLRKASVAGLSPLFLEYLKDKFKPENTPKYFLGKMFFVSGKGKNGGYKNKCIKILNFDECSGKPLNRISLAHSKKKVIDFHHNFLNINLPYIDKYDISDWYYQNGEKPKKYYKYLMALFIQNGILFENYLLNDEEMNFTKQIVIPAFLEIEKHFKFKPLIVRLLPSKSESELYWYWYPSSFEKSLVLK